MPPCIEPSTHDDLFQMMSPMDESPSPSAQATPTPSHEGRGHSTGLSPPLATVGAVCPPCGPSLLAKTSGQWKRLTGDPGKRINSGFNSFGGEEIRRIYSQLETSQRKDLNPDLILSDASSSKASTLKSILEKDWLRGTYPQRINLKLRIIGSGIHFISSKTIHLGAPPFIGNPHFFIQPSPRVRSIPNLLGPARLGGGLGFCTCRPEVDGCHVENPRQKYRYISVSKLCVCVHMNI